MPIFGDMDLADYEQATIMNFGVPKSKKWWFFSVSFGT